MSDDAFLEVLAGCTDACTNMDLSDDGWMPPDGNYDVLIEDVAAGIKEKNGMNNAWVKPSFNILDGEALSPGEMSKVFAGNDPIPFRESPAYEQWAIFVTGFVIKPIYMLISLVMIIILWRRKSVGLTALKWALVFFLSGELACAVNYIFFVGHSHLSEYLHSYGMVLCFAFATYAIIEGVDTHFVKFSSPEEKCAALGLCRSCYKYTDVPCGLKRLFFFLIPTSFLLTFMLLSTGPKMVSYNSRIFGRLYNYSHSVIYQRFETHYCAVIALAFFAIAFFVLIFKKEDPVSASKIFFAGGMGPLGFGLLRLVLFGSYDGNLVWLNVWEEVTELMFVVGIGVILWIFRYALLPTGEHP